MTTPAAPRAFTLIEILASLLLFAMGTMATIGVIIYGMASAAKAQADATAWMTATTVLKDQLPPGATADRLGRLTPWIWTRAGARWTANDGSGQAAWDCTTWPIAQSGDVLVPDMADPKANNPLVFPAGVPIAGCARGWLNGYYVERREQSRAADRLGDGIRVVEVRVDVYWAGYGPSDGRPLASAIDRVVRQAAP